ncbi:MAG: hypothetical protein ACR2LA_06490 [Acidimicrobiales bacterium]
MAEANPDTLTDTLRDAVYVGIGASVIVFQKLQVQRQELTKTINTQLGEARGSAKDSLGSVSDLVEDRVKDLEDRLEGLEGRLESVLAQIEDRLPGQARELVKQARDLVGRAA